MKTTPLIRHNAKQFSLTDIVENAAGYLKTNSISNCAVTEKGKVKGILSLELIELYPEAKTIDEIPLEHAICMTENSQLFERWFGIIEANAQSLTIVNTVDTYVDCIQQEELLNELKQALDYQPEDCIIIIHQRIQDFELSRIAHIAEEFNCKIKNCLTHQSGDKESLMICLHLNCSNIEKLIQSFTRHALEVDHIFCEGEQEEVLQKRLDHLMNYLNV